MRYELPSGLRCAQDLSFSGAVQAPKNPLGIAGRMIPIGPNQGSVLGARVKKWGNGTNNSRTAKPKDGAGHGMRSSRELANKNAK
jgi:hypothetical protein